MTAPWKASGFANSEAEDDRREQLAWLEMAAVGALKQRWAEVFGAPAPASLHSGMVRRAIAYRLQADCSGDLSPKLKRELMLIAKSAGTARRPQSAARLLPPGTRLVRVWRGKVYEVTVHSDGFEWEGRTYGSLSRLASEITGTHWNGLRFFGVGEGARG